MENREFPKVTRRELVTAVSAFFAGGLAGCDQSTGNEATPGRVVASSATPEVSELKGVLSDPFSPVIRSAGLIPELFGSDTHGEIRRNGAVSYLREYVKALEGQPSQRGEPLSKYLINRDNFPISIPFPPASNWNIWDVVNTLIKDVDSGKVQVVYNPQKTDSTAGQRSQFVFRNGKWEQQTSNINLGTDIAKKTYLWESSNRYYRSLTDADIALTILHEYGHTLQDLMLLSFINNTGDLLKTIGPNENLLREKLGLLVNGENAKIAGKFGFTKVAANEAQANALACMMLYSLNRMNQSEHFPGTVALDPTPKHIQVMHEQGYPNFKSLYGLFVENVLKDNALNKIWLQTTAS